MPEPADTQTPQETESAREKAAAEAASARVEAERKKAEYAEWLERKDLRDREALASARSLEIKNDEARRAAVQAVVPDLGKVDTGSTTGVDSTTLFEALLGGRALEDAAGKLIRVVKGEAGDNYRVLVTSEFDLAARDAGYLAIKQQLAAFKDRIDQYLTSPKVSAQAGAGIAWVGEAAVAAASLLPGLLSLISAKRTITNTKATLDDDIVVMAVAGALAGADAGATVVVDKARILADAGVVHQGWADLTEATQKLSEELKRLEQQLPADAARIDEGKDLLIACKTALSLMTTVPEGGRLTPLASAALDEALHSDDFHRILIVKGGAASTTQLVDDRPLRMADPVNIVSTATIAYLLLAHRQGSKVERGGLATGSAQITGKIGSKLDFSPVV